MSQLATYLQNLQRFGIKPGLERIVALLESAGNPQNSYPLALIGGTNGKGSTCELTARLLLQGERKIGLYTSPHLYQWNERIRVLPGEGLFEGAISDQELDTLFQDAHPHIEKVAASLGQPTEFEVVTFLGLWHFARQKVDAAVIEVGLGGKWDATNVTEPLVSVVTHVALDHMDRLGNTLEEIAADKVEIARPGRPFVTAEWKENVLAVFESHCERIGARLEKTPFHGDPERHPVIHFQQNRLTAIRAANELATSLGWPLPDPNTGGTSPQVPGRFEEISVEPKIVIDGANNPDGAQYIAYRLQGHHGVKPENLILVLGILADKDYEKMTHILAPLARTVIVTKSDSPRAASTAQVAAIAREIHPHVEEITPVIAAVERARALAGSDDTILVTGSFTTISEVPRA